MFLSRVTFLSRALLTFALICLVGATAMCAVRQGPAPGGKGLRTPAQRKIDSHLLAEISRRQGRETETSAPASPLVKIDTEGRALVDVRAPVTPELQDKIRGWNGIVVSTSAQYRSTIAWVPVLKLETLAEDAAVVSIAPQLGSMTNRKPLK